MIKGGFYGKLLKQSFIILLISCFTLLVNSSVNAEKICDGNFSCYDIDFGDGIYLDNGGLAGTVEDNNFNFAFNYFSWSSVRSNNLERRITYWWQSDSLYYTSRYWNLSSPKNGKINGFYVCSQRPYMQTAYRTLSNANFCTYKEGFSELNSYLNGTNKYSISCSSSNTYTNCMVCLVQETQGNYICIDNGNTSNNDNEFLEITQIETLATRNPYSSNSPIIPPSMSGSGNVVNPILTGDYLVNKCTYQEIIDYIENAGVNKYLCYGGLDNFDLYDSSINYNPIPGSGKTIQQILAYSNAWDTPKEWFNFRNGLRGGYNEMWSSYPAVYKTWFDLYYQYGGSTFNFNDILEYCNILQLDIDYSNTYYNGQYFKNTCVNGVKNPENNNDDGVVGTNWDGVGGKTGYTTYSDGTMFIQDYFNTLKSKFPTKYDLGLGFLPSYIIFFLLALVLFRFLAH